MDTFFPPALNSFWIVSNTPSTLPSCAGSFTAQNFCGARRMRAPLAPPRLSLPRKVEAEAQAVLTSSLTVRPDARIFALQCGYIGWHRGVGQQGSGPAR
jgi:hypothetical protein